MRKVHLGQREQGQADCDRYVGTQWDAVEHAGPHGRCVAVEGKPLWPPADVDADGRGQGCVRVPGGGWRARARSGGGGAGPAVRAQVRLAGCGWGEGVLSQPGGSCSFSLFFSVTFSLRCLIGITRGTDHSLQVLPCLGRGQRV